jgi:type III restriction enzyme
MSYSDRHLVQKALATKIEEYKKQAFSQGFQAMLFGDTAQVETSYEYAFRFKPNGYAPHWLYRGRYQFNNHFYPMVGELESDGEEFDCAQAIDRCDQIKHWVRNYVSFSSDSFRFLTATDYFYPDFVAELKDGRILVVEYKGAHLEPGEQEKRNIGERWEEKNVDKKALFLWAVKRDDRGRDVFKQVEDKTTSR